MITCSFAWRSRGSIVPTLDDVTNVGSITLMCQLGRAPHADISTAGARLFSTPTEVDTAKHLCRKSEDLHLSRSLLYCNVTDSPHFPLAIDAVDIQYNAFITITKANTRCILSDQFILSPVLPLHQIPRLPSPQTQFIVPPVALQHRYNGQEECNRPFPTVFPFNGASSALSIASPLFVMVIPSAKVTHTQFF